DSGARGLEIAANRVDVATEARKSKRDPRRDRDEGKHDNRHGAPHDHTLDDDLVVGLKIVDWIYAVPYDKSAKSRQGTERDNQWTDARPRDDRAIQYTAEEPNRDRRGECHEHVEERRILLREETGGDARNSQQ